MNAIRLWGAGVGWCQLEPYKDQYVWDMPQAANTKVLDNWLDWAQAQGREVIYTFGMTPAWAATGQSTGTISDGCLNVNGGANTAQTMPPRNEQDWINFVQHLVAHAGNRIQYYEMWNEADTPNYWAQTPATPGGPGPQARLATMTNEVSATLKSSGAQVLGANVTGSATGMTWLATYLNNLNANAIDIASVHTYTNGNSPESYLLGTPSKPGLVSQLQSTVAANNPNPTPLGYWSTEGGYGQTSQMSDTSARSLRGFVARYDLLLLANGFGRADWYAFAGKTWGPLCDSTTPPAGTSLIACTLAGSSTGNYLTPTGVATRTLVGWTDGQTAVPGWLAGGSLTATPPCSKTDGFWTCELTEPNGKTGRLVWVESGEATYNATGFTTVRHLDPGIEGDAPFTGSVTATVEPQLLER